MRRFFHLGKLYEEYYSCTGTDDVINVIQSKAEECVDEKPIDTTVEFDVPVEDRNTEPQQNGSVWSNLVKMVTTFMSES